MKTEMIERYEELSSALIDLRRFEGVMGRGEPPVVATKVNEMPGCYVHVSDKEFCDRVLSLARERIEEIVNEMQKG